MTFPVWKLTRTSFGRRVFDALADVGVMFSRLEQFTYAFDGSVPEIAVPDAISLRVDAPAAFSLSGRMNRPELSDRDRLVAAVANGRVVGVQPVTIDRPFPVEPLQRTIEFDGAYFWGLYVDPAWRRRGVATALVARALSFVAERTDRTRVQTLVGSDNVPSKRLLTGVGFERTRVRSYYRLFGARHRGQRRV